ncbi:MAG TPA: phosphatase PAP2 family protein [Dehalococcoidia bacterium]|nr:phosphatase PAP2 family protein [Dehalococcoidia bacterium]
MSATQLLKQTVGRLRPDFRDRYTRSACGGYVNADPTLDCTTSAQDGVIVSQKEVYDGMKSFPSGHAAVSFSLATYYALYQAGMDEKKLWNYDGSWAEWSYLEHLPIETN